MKTKKTVILTGATLDGIGEAILRKLNSEGWFVLGTYEKEQAEKAIRLEYELKSIELHQVEHANRDSLRSFTKKISDRQLSGLVNAQMFFQIENPDAFDHNLWDKSLAVNLSAPNFLFHELKSKLLEGSSIVTITSTEGFTGSFGASAYAATKAAIHNLVKTHANTIGKRNVRVNAIAAGWIGGVMDTDEIFDMSKKITPLGRLGSADEIANIVSFLLSPDSSFVNGSVIVADGGYSGVDTIAKHEFEQSQK
ncbi:MAG TPA: SDR family oxidoreductase [Bacteroidota bacterium]|nr:SDR family oxidoreductase [Bacteroidota bacterium]